jgi:hypothetical protein
MALDYTGSNTGIFDRGGKIVKYVNSRLTTATTTLPAELKAIADKFEAADMTDQISTLYGVYDAFKSNVTNERRTIASYFDNILLDRDSVLEQLAAGNSINQVLDLLFRQMVLDSQTVDKSTVTLGTVTAASGNTGNGTVRITKLLDGYNSPLSGGQSNRRYANLNSELCVPSETMRWTVTADSGRDGLTTGNEILDWRGNILNNGEFDWQDEGSGNGPSLTCANASTILVNGDMESFSSNVPTSWTRDNGTAGTHILKNTTAAYLYRGTSSLQFHGDGSAATIQISQNLSTRFNALRMYHVGVRIRYAGTTPAAGTVGVLFTGTGYTAGGTEQISQAASGLGTSFALYDFFVCMPTTFPSDFKLVVKITGTLTSGSDVYFDDITLTPVSYHGGIGAVALVGSTPFVIGDQFTATVANSEKVFQKFFRQKYRFQLPSNSSPSIADSLAT